MFPFLEVSDPFGEKNLLDLMLLLLLVMAMSFSVWVSMNRRVLCNRGAGAETTIPLAMSLSSSFLIGACLISIGFADTIRSIIVLQHYSSNIDNK